MKNILFILTLLISFSSFGQFSNEALDEIINERVWCITNIAVNGENKRPDGKWVYISGMNIVSGEDDRIDNMTDILNKVYSGDGITITSIGKWSNEPETVSLKILKSKEPATDMTVERSTEEAVDAQGKVIVDLEVELIGEYNNGKDYIELRFSCTSLIGRTGSLPPGNWNGNKYEATEESAPE